MHYAQIPGVPLPVSRIVFGTASPIFFAATRSLHGVEDGFDDALECAFHLLDAVYALGVNTFDCANHYGEEPLGAWLAARGLRDRVVVLTKGAHHNAFRKRVTPFDILSDAHDSLAKLGKPIELYLLHRDDESQPVGPIVEALNTLKAEGKILAFGGSNWTNRRIDEANAYAARHNLTPFTVSSPNYGLLDQVTDPWGGGCVSIAGRRGAQDRRWYEQNHMPIFAYSALGRGFLSGKLTSDAPEKAEQLLDEAGVKGYVSPENFACLKRCEHVARELGATVPDIATAYLFARPALSVFAVNGSQNPAHVAQAVAAAERTLSPETVAFLSGEDAE